MRKLVALALIAFICTGCFTIKYVAPTDSEVSTLSEYESASIKKETRVWYALWGLVPITDNSTETIIGQKKMKEVRVTSKLTFVDFIISIFTSVVSIVPHTVIVEGNQ